MPTISYSIRLLFCAAARTSSCVAGVCRTGVTQLRYLASPARTYLPPPRTLLAARLPACHAIRRCYRLPAFCYTTYFSAQLLRRIAAGLYIALRVCDTRVTHCPFSPAPSRHYKTFYFRSNAAALLLRSTHSTLRAHKTDEWFGRIHCRIRGSRLFRHAMRVYAFSLPCLAQAPLRRALACALRTALLPTPLFTFFAAQAVSLRATPPAYLIVARIADAHAPPHTTRPPHTEGLHCARRTHTRTRTHY